jgi:drug/metabolite transporter (DMT)-like permease
VSGAWVALIVLAGSLVGGMGVALLDTQRQPAPPVIAIVVLLVVGCLNGAAVYFQAMKVSDILVPTVSFIVTIIIVMLVMTPVYDFALNGATLTGKHLLGLILAIATVLVLAS